MFSNMIFILCTVDQTDKKKLEGKNLVALSL
jgi:hypothetical protein